jgi:hypothetical protein
MTEFMIPRLSSVEQRLQGFYEAISWGVRHHTTDPNFVYVQPLRGFSPTISYWQTENPNKIARFEQNHTDQPSHFSKGLWLPQLQDLVEISLIVPSDEIVHSLWARGGKLLEDHAHIPPRTHADAEEFRFSDPFNYSLRVTSDPGYEMRSTRY